MTAPRPNLDVAMLGLIVAAAIALLSLAGCGGARPLADGSAGHAPSAGADLVALGHAGIWLGGIAVAMGLVGRIWLGTIGAIVAEAGAVVLACGCAAVWLGEHLLLASVCALVAWAVYRRRSLAAFVRGRLDAGPSASVTPSTPVSK